MRVCERVAQIWPVLLFAAFHRQTTEYETLGRLIGVPRGEIGALLGPLRRYCLQHGIPDLTVVVTGEIDAEPNLSASDLRAARIAVFHHAWLDEPTPAPADFEPFCLPD
jgi:hypothetical protein